MRIPTAMIRECIVIVIVNVLSFARALSAELLTAPAPRLPAGVNAPDAQTIYVANRAGDCDALDVSTGKLKWSAAGPLSPVLATADGVIVAMIAPDCKQFTLVTLAPDTGKRLRESEAIKLNHLKQSDQAELKIEVVTQSESPTVCMAYWRIMTKHVNGTSSALGRSRVNLETGHAEDARKGANLLTWEAAFARPFPVMNLAGHKLQVIETADGDERTERTLRATHADSGKPAWEHALQGVRGKSCVRAIRMVGGSLVSADGAIGFIERTSAAAGIDAVDLRTGKTLWETKEVRQPLFALDGALLAADWRKGGTELVIIWLDPVTGKLLREAEAQSVGPPPELPSFGVDAIHCAADGQLSVSWTIWTRQQFGAAGLAESMTVTGTFRLNLGTSKVSDAKSERGRKGPTLDEFRDTREIDRTELNGLNVAIQNRSETKPDVIVYHYTLRAFDATGKVAWEHALPSREMLTRQPPGAPSR